MLFIGICGASGSGKTTLAWELVRDMGVESVVLNQDAYYTDHSDLTFEERTHLNYDEPGIFDHDLLYQDVCDLMAGRPITRKAYDFTEHRRCDTTQIIYPAPVLILEGIHAFYDDRLREKMFLKLYINVEPDICLCAASAAISRTAAARSTTSPSSTFPPSSPCTTAGSAIISTTRTSW